MISPQDSIVVAVSGGPDSIALLHYLNSIRNNKPRLWRGKLHIAHLNHGIRGKNADRDALFVGKLSKKLGISCTIKKADIPVMAQKLKVSFEEAGRIARYDFLGKVAQQIKANKIAVAHTADDNIETFLMRLRRGAGLRGLCGIPPVRGLIMRPMIDVLKSEVLKYCKDNNLEYRSDETNFESKYTRNKVRNKLIPQLLKHDPKIKEKLLSKMKAISTEYAFIRRKAEKYFSAKGGKAAKEVLANKIILDSEIVSNMPFPVKSELIRLSIEKIKGNLNNVSSGHIKDIINLRKGYMCLPEGVYVSLLDENLIISNEKPKQKQKISFKHVLKIPGKIKIKKTGKAISVSFAKKMPLIKNIRPNHAYMDFSKIKGGSLIVRSFRQGDNFIPFGMRGRKKLHDYFIDKKVPAEERCKIPVICDSEKIIWIAGHRLDDRVKIDSQTKKIACLRLIP